jgi:hypothetical protein
VSNLETIRENKKAWRELLSILKNYVSSPGVRETILRYLDHYPLQHETFIRTLGDLHQAHAKDVLPGTWKSLTTWYARWQSEGLALRVYPMKIAKAESPIGKILDGSVPGEEDRAALRALLEARPINRDAIMSLLVSVQDRGGCSPGLPRLLVDFLQGDLPVTGSASGSGAGKVIKFDFAGVGASDDRKGEQSKTGKKPKIKPIKGESAERRLERRSEL